MGLLASLCDDTRSDWGARSPSGVVNTVPITDKDYFVNHWDGDTALGLAAKPHSACLARVKADQNFHMGSSRGWSDIGYNVLICPHGRAIEGRGLLTVGAHKPGYNRSGIGVQYMVGRGDKLSAAMLSRGRRLYDQIAALRHGEATRKATHNDGYATTCPGAELTTWTHNGMPTMGPGSAIPAPFPTIPRPAPSKIVGPRFAFPLASGYFFGVDDGSKWSVSGRYQRVFKGRRDRAWIQEFASQLTRRGWNVKRYLVSGNDGIFGREYVALVKAFQKDRGLTADGKIGKKTWDAAFNSPVS